MVFQVPGRLCLLGAGVLGDCLGSLRDSVLGEFTRQEKSDSGLDFTGSDGGPLVIVSKSACLSSNTLEEIIDERVHDAHGFGRNSSVRVDLLEDLVDVDGVGFLPSCLLLSLLISLGDSFCSLSSGFGGFSRGLWWHVGCVEVQMN